MTVDYKNGAVEKSDLLLPYISIANGSASDKPDVIEKLRMDPKYLVSTSPRLPMDIKVKARLGLRVRDEPLTGNILTTLEDKTPITVFKMRKVGNSIWGLTTETGIEGWVSMLYTTWKDVPNVQ